jgi:hypothetical protein
MSKTKAEIEAEIARLRAKLEHVEIDPAFTPAELVRWDPSLLGAVLHIKHERNIPRDAFQHLLTVDPVAEITNALSIEYAYGSSVSKEQWVQGGCILPGSKSHRVMEKSGVLTQTGLQFTEYQYIENRAMRPKIGTCNEFQPFTDLSLEYTLCRKSTNPANPTIVGPGGFDLKCSDLRMSVKSNHLSLPNLVLPLASPERFLLDQIFVATSTRFSTSGTDTDIIVDKYPLSTLYNEWKRDKAAAPDVMTMCGARRPTVPPLRRTELDKAKEQIAELQAQVRLLLANREADRKAAELSKQNERLREALHIAVQTTNATASTNAMDPM